MVLDAEGAFFGTACSGRYSDGDPHVEVILKSYDAESCLVDRKTGSLSIDHPRLTIGNLVQPDVWNALCKKQMLEDRGLIPRILVARVPSTVGLGKFADKADREGVASATARFRELVLTLFAYNDPRLVDDPSLEVLRFSEPAEQVFGAFYDAHQSRRTDDDGLGAVPAWASKQLGFIARISGLHHVVECFANGIDLALASSLPITEGSVRASIKIVDYFEQHKLALARGASKSTAPSDAERIAGWIVRRKGPRTMTKRDIQTGVRSVKGVTAITGALVELVHRGYVKATGNVIEVRPELTDNGQAKVP